MEMGRVLSWGARRCVGFRSEDVVCDQGAGERWPQVYRAVSIAGYRRVFEQLVGRFCSREDCLLDSAQVSTCLRVGGGGPGKRCYKNPGVLPLASGRALGEGRSM